MTRASAQHRAPHAALFLLCPYTIKYTPPHTEVHIKKTRPAKAERVFLAYLIENEPMPILQEQAVEEEPT